MAILDFGAGEGDTSLLLSELGANVTAVDPYGFDLCKAKGLTTFRLLEALAPEAQFDGIMMTEVIEHLPNPVQTLRELSLRLRGGGWIFVTTPNNASLKASLLRERWADCEKLGHLILFSRRGLSLALSSGGFERVIPARGLVRFSPNPIRFFPQYLLQTMGIDGQLRLIGIKANGGG